MDFKLIEEKFREVINANSVDAEFGIPDFVLAKHAMDALILLRREHRDINRWRGIPDYAPGQKITVE